MTDLRIPMEATATGNGHRLADIVKDSATNRLGIDTLPQIITRGLLLDAPSVPGTDRLEAGEVVTPRTRKQRWPPGCRCDPATRSCSTPGGGCGTPTTRPTPTANQDPASPWVAGSPTAGWPSPAATPAALALPARDPAEPFVVPQVLNTHHGIVVAENLRLEQIARERVVEFLLVVSHAKLRGATGAWATPLAII